MECPKDKTQLLRSELSGKLPSWHCPDCGGDWISPEDYDEWQQHQQYSTFVRFPNPMEPSESAPMDSKGGLCPDCKIILSRARVGTKKPFYVERCGRCNGIWCDLGEWEILRKLDLHAVIDVLFTSEWQAKVKVFEYADRERRATIEKLGEDLAQKVFELAELLEQHPNGDFGVAYLMRRFEK